VSSEIFKEAKARGELMAHIEVAEKMLLNSMDIELIAHVTSLTPEEVEDLLITLKIEKPGHR